jgi:hypothetical protein
MQVDGEMARLVLGKAANTPFGTISLLDTMRVKGDTLR